MTMQVVPDRVCGMTKKLAISVPDDVATRLAMEDNVSAFVTQLVRNWVGGEAIRRIYRERGNPLSEDRIRAAGEEVHALQTGLTPETRARLEAFSAKVQDRDREFLERTTIRADRG